MPPKKKLMCASCGRENVASRLKKCEFSGCSRRFCFGKNGCLQRQSLDQPFHCDLCCQSQNRDFPDVLPIRILDGTPKTVFLCIWYLARLKLEANDFQLTIEGVLEAHNLTVHTSLQPLEQLYEGATFYEYLYDLDACEVEDAALLICVLTEGTINEEGGLWVDETEEKNWHMPFKTFFQRCLSLGAVEVNELMRKFKRRTVIPVACGVGLREPSLREFGEWLTETELIDEVILPSNMSIIAAAILGFAMHLVVMLYVEGADIETSLIRSWLGDEVTRHHTGLLLMRPRKPIEMKYGQSYIRYNWPESEKQIMLNGIEFLEISTVAGLGLSHTTLTGKETFPSDDECSDMSISDVE
ncbi:unnamed protein product [Rhizoctonia solani]|uniref:Uncharacterized protein n=1 Tax=Rhizoctonia solani TaxID=456999 RepID=A0A8H2XA15_9AGAM